MMALITVMRIVDRVHMRVMMLNLMSQLLSLTMVHRVHMTAIFLLVSFLMKRLYIVRFFMMGN